METENSKCTGLCGTCQLMIEKQDKYVCLEELNYSSGSQPVGHYPFGGQTPLL